MRDEFLICDLCKKVVKANAKESFKWYHLDVAICEDSRRPIQDKMNLEPQHSTMDLCPICGYRIFIDGVPKAIELLHKPGKSEGFITYSID